MKQIKMGRQSSNNKENMDYVKLAKVKAMINSLTEKDFEITEEKIRKYQERRPEKSIIDARVKGLVECPACGNVYNKMQWGVHRWKELHKTEPPKKTIFINKEGFYKCVIDHCDWKGSKCHTHFKTHLITHGFEALSKATVPVEVRKNSSCLLI